MGKITGFLEYEREDNSALSPLGRIENFSEFHPPLGEAERRRQGARCMNCGVPFCQSIIRLGNMTTGCPLHNLIPEWNDEVFNGNYQHALSRLLKTSTFPEFTGRVCPALCEKSCLCGVNGDPVTIRENELFIIEKGFEEGTMIPRPPQVRTDKKVAVVGSGPAGLAVADRLNRRGHNVTVFEKADRIGGLLMYGIPNMKLEKHIVDRRVRLMEQEGITFVTGADVGGELPAQDILNQYDAVVLCCGAKQPRSLQVEGGPAEGVHYAVDFLTSTTRSLLEHGLQEDTYLSAKGKRVVVVGGGDTGNDCIGTCIRHGCKSIIQLEMMPKPPAQRAASNPWPEWPKTLKTDYGQEEAIAVFGEDPRQYETTVKQLLSQDGKLTGVKTVKVHFQDGKLQEVPDSEQVLDADLLLIAAGFVGCEPYVPEAFGVELTARNTVNSEEGNYKTNVDKVFSAGDMRRGQSLVVWAIAEGNRCAKQVDKYLMGYTNME